MKTWHIAALVIVGLIVAGIAYTMYEKKRGRIPLGGVFDVGGSAVLNNHQRQKDDPSIIPGDVKNGKTEPERPAGPGHGYVRSWPEGGSGYGEDRLGRRVYGPTRKTLEAGRQRMTDKADGDFWDAFQNWL
jgi:hypothetical protein